MKTIVIDYNVGNLGSIRNMIKKIGYDAEVTSDLKLINQADKLILPGVGSFDYGITQLNKSGIRKVLDKKVINDRIPILGICLGMQLLTNSSMEGVEKGLEYIDAETLKFNPTEKYFRVPHMGWNSINITQKNVLIEDVDPKNSKYYFVHSYYVKCNNRNDVIAESDHGQLFDSIIGSKNIYGTQFHPEKSHKHGMLILKNFLKNV